ncbi:MAG TPA: DUF2723 domain-containing protein [Anaerolineales bacterium]|nr:DUF2723 domain-containing protein [Anaerolineales bacterium]
MLRQRFPIVLALASICLYVSTLAPDILPSDAGEFQVVSAVLGVAHPPGFALYTLLGHVWGLFFSSPAYALNLLSVVTAALTLYCLYQAVQTSQPTATPLAKRMVGTAVVVFIATSTTFWSLATTANVRSLAGLCLVGALWAFSAYPSTTAPTTPTSRPLLAFVICLSIGITHHASLIFIGATLSLGLLAINARFLRQPRQWLAIGLAGALPLIVLLYFPWRGSVGAFLAGEKLATWQGFREHIFATGFGGDFFYYAQLSALLDRLRILWNIGEFQFGNPLWGIALLLALPALRHKSGWFGWAALLIHAWVAITYRAPQTVEYLLPAYLLLAWLVGQSLLSLHPALTRPLALLILGLALWQGTRNFPAYRTLAQDNSTRQTAQALLEQAPPDALVLANWHWATPLWYLQQVEGLRADVEVRYVYPHGESLAQNWVDELRANIGKRPLVVTSFYPNEFSASELAFTPLGSALGVGWLVTLHYPTQLPVGLTPVQYSWQDNWQLVGKRAVAEEVTLGESIPLWLVWQAPPALQDIRFFAQLIAPDGTISAQFDTNYPASQLRAGDLLAARYPLTVSPFAPLGEHTLQVGAYLPDGTRLLTQDGQPAQALGKLRILPATHPLPSPHSLPLHPYFSGYGYDFTLPDQPRLRVQCRPSPMGFSFQFDVDGAHDGDSTCPPNAGYSIISLAAAPTQPYLQVASQRTTLQASHPSERWQTFGGDLLLVDVSQWMDGTEWVVDLQWQALRPLTADWVVSVQAWGDGWQAQHDFIPAGGAIPTLKWIPGYTLHDRHRIPLPANADPSTAHLTLTVYDHFSGQVLPLGDWRLTRTGQNLPIH